jgi:beta-N-acetylhexosaminidase
MDLILCAAQDVTQGEQASAELAADYTDGTLDGPTFLAAVNRVITLRQSLA